MSIEFSLIDRQFSEFIQQLAKEHSLDIQESLGSAAALVSRWLAEGHTCLPLADLAGQEYPFMPEEAGFIGYQVKCPELERWQNDLRSCNGIVGTPTNATSTPLVLDDRGRLYLHRYWHYEKSVVIDLHARILQGGLLVDLNRLKESLDRFFPDKKEEINWQKVAVMNSATRHFSVITGGPGTGKTYAVARLLAALLEQPEGKEKTIRVVAPTGKAVARISESLKRAIEDLDCADEIKTRLQEKNLTSTIHRLLGVIPNSTRFRYHRDHPLAVDILVIDEASMVSLSLMSKLLAALPAEARVILVGDKDQLPPVDPGSVLGDLCRASDLNGFSSGFQAKWQAFTGQSLPGSNHQAGLLQDTIVELQTNHRTEAEILSRLNHAVNAGQLADVEELASEGSFQWDQALPGLGKGAEDQRNALKSALKEVVDRYFAPVLAAQSVQEALEVFGKFRILCAVRDGVYGVESMNRLVEELLAKKLGSKYKGKPVMVTANHYLLRLFNGDIGMIWGDKNLLVNFEAEAGGLREVALERLPDHESAFAMTIHKSQGSEFDHLLMILPPHSEMPILNRELIYTGLTRARKSVKLWAVPEVMEAALKKTSQRASGLTEALKVGNGLDGALVH